MGILKQMGSEMEADVRTMIADEESSTAHFNSLIASKDKEVASMTKAIEVKTGQAGETSVAIAKLENDLEDTEEQLSTDSAFLAEVKASCEKKQMEWSVYQKTKKHEELCLTETITILNDDDAAGTFSKAMPESEEPSAVFLQVSSATQQRQQLSALKHKKRRAVDRRSALIALALSGRKGGFKKVVQQINEMKILLATEQTDDDKKKEYCAGALDKTDDAKKSLSRSISDIEKSMSELKSGIESVQAEIESVSASIKEMDEQVEEQTKMRKAENSEFQMVLGNNNAVIQLLEMTKTRLNKFYNPDQEAQPAEAAASFLQLSQRQPRGAPKADLNYNKKKEESSSVMEMLTMLVQSVNTNNLQAKDEEKNAQADYEAFMEESAKKRAEDSKGLSDKEGAKAELDGELGKAKEEQKAQKAMLRETEQELANLHSECDWLLKEYDVRAEARASETEALGKAASVLHGASS